MMPRRNLFASGAYEAKDSGLWRLNHKNLVNGGEVQS